MANSVKVGNNDEAEAKNSKTQAKSNTAKIKNENSITKKRRQKNAIAFEMIKYYCRKNHKARELCSECAALAEYSKKRTDHCPFVGTSTYCSGCKIKCYSDKMRSKIKNVMRYSGPRMVFSHPLLVLGHLFK